MKKPTIPGYRVQTAKVRSSAAKSIGDYKSSFIKE